MTPDTDPPPPIRRRRIVYLHGFDPASTRRYLRIFQTASHGKGVQIEELPDGEDGWRCIREGAVTDVHFLRYDSAVRTFKDRSAIARLGRGFRSIIGMAVDGGLWRMAHRAPKALVIMIWPAAVTFLPLVLAAALLPPDPFPALLGLALTAALIALMIWRFMLVMVADAYAIERHLATSDVMLWDALRKEMTARLSAQSEHGADETLVVGHSLGGIAAIDLVAEALPTLDADQQINILTMGSILNMILIQRGPGQRRLVDALHRVTSDRRVFWVDVSSPRDPFLPALVDPLLLTGGAAGCQSPLVIAAQLARVDKIPGDRRTVFPAMRRHMGYLLAAPPGAGFDYADVATGSLSLRSRFGDRANSPRARMWQG